MFGILGVTVGWQVFTGKYADNYPVEGVKNRH